MENLFFVVVLKTVVSAPYWPSSPTYDIWGSAPNNKIDTTTTAADKYLINSTAGNGRVLNFFPVPVDDECLSLDGRRSGVCLNTYECRMQGGDSRGVCALGFGVCCVFTASCNQEVFNNLTYVVSPGFPGLSREQTSCQIKIKMMHPDISQIRLDFIHFNMGQPNRRTGVCDGDIFSMSGGTGNDFQMCGQNSGQHVYFDVDGARADPVSIWLNMSRKENPRMWEIKVTQVPFGQRAPSGCLQHYTGLTGIIQTMNFAENGRHLANQHYRACVRQETGMCSIAYEPCDDNSFRIGPGSDITNSSPIGGSPLGGSGVMPLAGAGVPAGATGVGDGVQPAPVLMDQVADGSSADDVDGSGGGELNDIPVPRWPRQIQQDLKCSDRITMPCIVEDFIPAGSAAPPFCQPSHCGSSLCLGVPEGTSCRLESNVTPFGLGIHFGPGQEKGSPEDNIGACLKFSQVPCTV